MAAHSYQYLVSETSVPSLSMEGAHAFEFSFTPPPAMVAAPGLTSEDFNAGATIGYPLPNHAQSLGQPAMPSLPSSTSVSYGTDTPPSLASVPATTFIANGYAGAVLDAFRFQVGSDARALAAYARRHKGQAHSASYQCSRCSRTFMRRTNLSDHIMRHENRRAYRCPFVHSCSARHNTKGDLRSHVKRVHGRPKAL